MMKADEDPSEATQRIAALRLQLTIALDDFHDQRKVCCSRVEVCGVSTSAAMRFGVVAYVANTDGSTKTSDTRV